MGIGAKAYDDVAGMDEILGFNPVRFKGRSLLGEVWAVPYFTLN